MDMQRVRQSSWECATSLGFPKNENLPLSEIEYVCRHKHQLVDRVFGMLCVAACAYGHNRKQALEWLAQNGGLELLTETERAFLGGATANVVPFIEQIEGMWALCWCLKIIPELDFSKPCSGDFVKLLPDLKRNESGAAFRKKASINDIEMIIAKADLAFCLHWGLVDAGISARSIGMIKPYIIVERRKAIQWSLSDEKWEEIVLDT